MNTETVEVDAAPSFYAVATSSNFLSTIVIQKILGIKFLYLEQFAPLVRL